MSIKIKLTHPTGEVTWMYAPDSNLKNERMTQVQTKADATSFVLLPYKKGDDHAETNYLQVENGTLYLDKNAVKSHLFLSSPVANVRDSSIYAWRINSETGLMDAVRAPLIDKTFAIVKAKRSPPKLNGTNADNNRYNKLNCSAFDKNNALLAEFVVDVL